MKQDIIVLKAFDLCGEHCVGIDDGVCYYKEIIKALDSHAKVRLDFVNVFTITSSFLNASVGRLIGKLGSSFDKQISWEHMDKNDSELMKLVIENAKEHFAKTERERDIEKNITQQVLG